MFWLHRSIDAAFYDAMTFYIKEYEKIARIIY